MHIILNLLPEEQKERLRKKRLFGIVLQQELYAFFLLLFLISILATIFLVLNNRVVLGEKIALLEQQQGSAQSLKNYEELFVQTRKQVRVVEETSTKHLYWSHIFVILNDTVIDGIVLSSLETNEQKIILKGTARDREALKRQREVLSDYQEGEQRCFENVDAPNEDIFQKEDINFTVTLDVAQVCLTQQ